MGSPRFAFAATERGALIWDEAHGGLSGFVWLPPPRPAIRGELLPSLSPVVRIDQINATGSVVRSIGAWTKTSGPDEQRVRTRLPDDEPIGFSCCAGDRANTTWRTRRTIGSA